MQSDRMVNNIYAVIRYMYKDINIPKSTIKSVINKADKTSIRKEVKNVIIRMSSAYNYIYTQGRQDIDLKYATIVYDILTGLPINLKESPAIADRNIQELYEVYSSTEGIIDVFILYFIREFVHNNYYEVFLIMLEKYLITKGKSLNIVDYESFNNAISEVVSGCWDYKTLTTIKSFIVGG